MRHFGTQFDAELGKAFIQFGEAGRLDHIVGHSEPRIPLQTCPACGPIILITHAHKDGDHVYCRACGGEAKVSRKGNEVKIEPTGRRGDAAALEPDVDDVLIDRLVQAADVILRGTRPSLFDRLRKRFEPTPTTA